MMKTAPLSRRIFRTSRLAEFCSQKELINQTGHAIAEWPLVVLKELLDNALDACEEAGTAPVIDIEVSQDGIVISDNGPGLAPETIDDLLDYTVRVSSREAYVSPTRGAQGNALKTLIAMPFALDGDRGRILIESRGVAHEIEFTVDPIRQEPRIAHARDASLVKTGARVTVFWPDSTRSILDCAKARFLQVAEDYTWCNPHLTLSVHWSRDGAATRLSIAATNAGWRKWSPADPTSPHWYNEFRLARLMGAHIAHAEDNGAACPTVREFVSEFHGLSSTGKGKQICDAVGAARMSLKEFYGDGNGSIDALLQEMCESSRPIKPKALGAIGKDHLAAKFVALGVAPESFDYRRAEFDYDGLPYLAEVAFGYCPNGSNVRRITVVVNWAAAIGADPFRRLGPAGESLDAILTNQRAGRREPIVTVIHLACPMVAYLDRGKSSIAIPGSAA
jgi:DNA topoisomerase VI subunit B